ncbi:MAG: ABC transporter permease [Thermoleophilia bacterium]
MDKRRYFVRKLLNAVLTIILVASFNFALFRILPGDPARLLLPKGKQPAGAVEKQRKVFNLDKPRWQQFVLYWGDTVRGEFGMSFSERRPVTEVVAERIWPTVILVGTGTLFATVIGMITGVFAGWRRNGVFDVATTNSGMVFYAMPTFWFGLLMIMLFATRLGWFPTGRLEEAGAGLPLFGPIPTSWESFTSLARHLFLPAFTFAIAYVGEYHLIMRSSITGVMKEDFALTARAKGLSENAVLWRHVVPNAMLPTVTIVMMNIGFVMSGAILDETVFNWPGLGLLAYEAMQKRDYPVMQAVFLIASIAVIAANLIADIMYYYLDPRVQA